MSDISIAAIRRAIGALRAAGHLLITSADDAESCKAVPERAIVLLYTGSRRALDILLPVAAELDELIVGQVTDDPVWLAELHSMSDELEHSINLLLEGAPL